MASKRSTKKQIRYICGDLAAECIIAKNMIEGVNEHEMAKIVVEVAHLQQATLRKASIADTRSAFSAIKSEFNKSVGEIVKKMNSVLTKEQKALNKELANS